MLKQAIPDYVEKYFWGDNIAELDLNRNKKYIIQTLLDKGNRKAVKWLLQVFGTESVRNILSEIKLSKKSANFWNLYLS